MAPRDASSWRRRASDITAPQRVLMRRRDEDEARRLAAGFLRHLHAFLVHRQMADAQAIGLQHGARAQ